jgi:predicted XRE-type DNA-binding protein
VYENLDINNLDGEVWKVIEEFPDYSVSNFGRVKSLKFGKEKIRKQHKRGKYLSIDLWKNGKYKNKYVHILVFETHSNCKLKSYEDVHHVNGCKENNIFDNLTMTPESGHRSFHKKGENNPLFGKNHSEKTKLKMSKNHANVKGEKHPNHKLTEEQVIQIKLLLKEGILTQQKIADMFGVSRRTISMIKTGKRWTNL